MLEESGLIIEVGAWVRRTALNISRRWRENGQFGLRIAVNVSPSRTRIWVTPGTARSWSVPGLGMPWPSQPLIQATRGSPNSMSVEPVPWSPAPWTKSTPRQGAWGASSVPGSRVAGSSGAAIDLEE